MAVPPPVAPPLVEHPVPDVPVTEDGLREPANLLPVGIHPDDLPLGMVVHPQQRVAREDDPVGLHDLAGTLSASRDRAQVLAVGSEGPDLDRLVVQHVDGAVARGLDSPDVAEDEVRVVPLAAPEPEVDLHVGDSRTDGIDGGQIRVADEDRPVGKRLACRVVHRRFGFAGREGDGGDEYDRHAEHVSLPPFHDNENGALTTYCTPTSSTTQV